jgi:hypothetical protein
MTPTRVLETAEVDIAYDVHGPYRLDVEPGGPLVG